MTAQCQRMDGVFASDGININIGTVVDSFDSSTSLHSIWQSNYVYRANYFSPGINYGVWSNILSYVSNSYPSRTANASVYTASNDLTLAGSPTIAGYLLTGPNATNNMSGSVGDLAWCFGPSGNGSGASTGIEPGHYLTNANFNFRSYSLPTPANAINGWMNWSNVPSNFASGSVIKIGGMWEYITGKWTNVGGTYYTNSGGSFTIGGVRYSYVITNRVENTNWVYYWAPANEFNNQNLFVDAQYVVLFCTNGFSLGGGDYFTINTNADIQIWSEGNVSVNGGGVLNNMGDFAHALTVYDVAGHPISVSLTSDAAATGFFYVPSSTVTLSGGNFVGSVICNNFLASGGCAIHCDDSLGEPLFPTPILSGLLNATNGLFQLNITGVTGLNYAVQASTNMVDWVSLCTNAAPFSFEDSNMDIIPQRFYRSVYIPFSP